MSDGPAGGGFAAVVGEGLRDVFEDGEEELDVGEGVELDFCQLDRRDE